MPNRYIYLGYNISTPEGTMNCTHEHVTLWMSNHRHHKHPPPNNMGDRYSSASSVYSTVRWWEKMVSFTSEQTEVLDHHLPSLPLHDSRTEGDFVCFTFRMRRFDRQHKFLFSQIPVRKSFHPRTIIMAWSVVGCVRCAEVVRYRGLKRRVEVIIPFIAMCIVPHKNGYDHGNCCTTQGSSFAIDLIVWLRSLCTTEICNYETQGAAIEFL